MNTIVAVNESQLIRREPVAEGTMAFRFAKPAGFHFTAGNAANLTLLEPPQTDGKGNTRTFSIVSTPSESELMFATRMRDSAFKRDAAGQRIVTHITLALPVRWRAVTSYADVAAELQARGIGPGAAPGAAGGIDRAYHRCHGRRHQPETPRRRSRPRHPHPPGPG